MAGVEGWQVSELHICVAMFNCYNQSDRPARLPVEHIRVRSRGIGLVSVLCNQAVWGKKNLAALCETTGYEAP